MVPFPYVALDISKLARTKNVMTIFVAKHFDLAYIRNQFLVQIHKSVYKSRKIQTNTIEKNIRVEGEEKDVRCKGNYIVEPG